MEHEGASAAAPVWSFGPFRLDARQQALFEGDRRIRLGSRAFGILLALVEQAGKLVTRDALAARVWSGIFVDDSTLRVHVAALRKVLGAAEGERRHIVNVPGRGYVFAVPARRLDQPAADPAPARGAGSRLPPSLVRMVGREETRRSLAAQLEDRRLLTIAGPGGMGKTTLALAVAEALAGRYADGAHFLDLAALADPDHLPAALAGTLGLPWPEGGLRELAAALRGRAMLLVMDSCEHLVDAAAEMAETLLAGVPDLRVLATSREPLRAAGEWVHRLAPLDLPPPGPLTAAEARRHAAVQLLEERAAASLHGFTLRDADAPLAAAICRRLEGMPLAIELAAARIEVLGLAGLAEGLEDSLAALTRGRRAAVPRHRTLRATLDWSHELLDPAEQAMLRRLSVFRGSFSLAAAQEIAGGAEGCRVAAIDAIASLAAKSLLAVDISGEAPRYRLLAMTRTYAAEKLAGSSEQAEVAARHARLCLAALAGAERDRHALSQDAWLARHGGWIEDVRAALDHCLAPGGEAATGVALAAASAPLWFALSLEQEFRGHAARALAALPAGPACNGETRPSPFAGAAIAGTRGPLPARQSRAATAVGGRSAPEIGRGRSIALGEDGAHGAELALLRRALDLARAPGGERQVVARTAQALRRPGCGDDDLPRTDARFARG